jgi:hypothetical protein
MVTKEPEASESTALKTFPALAAAFIVYETFTFAPWQYVKGEIADVLMVVNAAPAVMVKFVLLMSKKMLPTASTFILACVVGVLGTVMLAVPSFGVLAEITVGKVFPPSVESEIFTLAQFTGAPVVLATFHVTVCVLSPTHETAVFGTVTTNGPVAELTVTTISSLLFAGPPAWLSRTVKRKFNVLATDDNASTVMSVPAVVVEPAMVEDNIGQYLTGLAD